MKTRRNFLRASALTLAAPLALPLTSSASSIASVFEPSAAKELNLGLAGYTFAQFKWDQAVAMMQKLNVKNISLKEMHLPLDSSPEKISEFVTQAKASGINIYAVGVIYMKDKAEVDRAFNYAKNVGVSLIVGVPEYELLTYTEEKVKSTGIKMAIHNHGPEDKRYPSPKDVYDRIKDMDSKMGLCIDIGHSLRAGTLPAKAIEMYKSRLFDLHIKDINTAAKDGKGIEFGRGVMDFPGVVKALRKVKFTGMCSIEYEKDMKDPMAGIAESVGFFNAVNKYV